MNAEREILKLKKDVVKLKTIIALHFPKQVLKPKSRSTKKAELKKGLTN